VQTNVVTLDVSDPCISTQINTQSISRSLTGAYGSPDAYMIEPWPFTDTVDLALMPQVYGLGKCGRVLGQVQTQAGEPVSFVFFNNDTGELLLYPAQNTYPATYGLVIQFYMEKFPDRSANEGFIVVVEKCVTQIKTNGAMLEDRQTGWGE